MKIKTAAVLAMLALVLSLPLPALEWAVMKDGRNVVLYDDGTYEILPLEEEGSIIGSIYFVDNYAFLDTVVAETLKGKGLEKGSAEYEKAYRETRELLIASGLGAIRKTSTFSSISFLSETRMKMTVPGGGWMTVEYEITGDKELYVYNPEAEKMELLGYLKDGNKRLEIVEDGSVFVFIKAEAGVTV